MKTRKIVYAGLLVACGVILPQIFHIVGGPALGKVFLPMHISVLIAGYLIDPLTALMVGVLTPICSFLFTGGSMPSIPMIYFMIIELGFYGIVISLLFNKFKVGIIISLLGGMVAGRVARGVGFVVLTKLFAISLPPNLGVSAAITQGIPGILLQIIIIPSIIVIIRKKDG